MVTTGEKLQPVPNQMTRKEESISVFFCSTACAYYEILPMGEFDGLLQTTAKDGVSSPGFAPAPRQLLIFLDNVQPHHVKKTRDELEKLGSIWLLHSPYSTTSVLVTLKHSGVLRSTQGVRNSQPPEVKSAVDEYISSLFGRTV